MHKAWFYCIKVNDTDGLAGLVINHYVVDLGIAMDNPLLQLILLSPIFQYWSPASPIPDKLSAKLLFF